VLSYSRIFSSCVGEQLTLAETVETSNGRKGGARAQAQDDQPNSRTGSGARADQAIALLYRPTTVFRSCRPRPVPHHLQRAQARQECVSQTRCLYSFPLRLTPLDHITEIKYVIFKLSDDNKEIVVEKTSESGEYDDFVADLPGESCRYAVYDFQFDQGEGQRNKITFIAW